jgi:two-component system, sensor histidine kinase and response regulator
MTTAVQTAPVPGPALLLVDDRRENLLAVEAALSPLGHRTLWATSGEEALRCLLHEDVGVIVLDVQMPQMDGFEVAAHIKQRERTRDIPIIFLTAISREEGHRLRGFETGAVDYLFKPIDAELLRAKVAVFFDLHMKSRLLAEQAERLERQRADLARSNADLEQFSYIASHDLQEPLRVITGFLELLALRLDDRLDEEARDWMTRIRRAAGGMSDLLDGLLAYARASGHQRDAEIVDLDEALQTALERIDLGTATVRSDPLGMVHSWHADVVAVFGHLVSNALKYAGDDAAEISVSADRSQAMVTVSVRDNGRGVAETDLERVFGMFERLEGDPYPGTGLGLALCRRIVERSGGRIWMRNNRDRGVTVSFTMPAAVPA